MFRKGLGPPQNLPPCPLPGYPGWDLRTVSPQGPALIGRSGQPGCATFRGRDFGRSCPDLVHVDVAVYTATPEEVVAGRAVPAATHTLVDRPGQEGGFSMAAVIELIQQLVS